MGTAAVVAFRAWAGFQGNLSGQMITKPIGEVNYGSAIGSALAGALSTFPGIYLSGQPYWIGVTGRIPGIAPAMTSSVLGTQLGTTQSESESSAGCL